MYFLVLTTMTASEENSSCTCHRKQFVFFTVLSSVFTLDMYTILGFGQGQTMVSKSSLAKIVLCLPKEVKQNQFDGKSETNCSKKSSSQRHDKDQQNSLCCHVYASLFPARHHRHLPAAFSACQKNFKVYRENLHCN